MGEPVTVTRYENSLRRDLTRWGKSSLRLNPKILSPRRRVLQPQAIHHDFSLRRVPLAWARCFLAQFMGYSPERAPRTQPPHFTISHLGEIPSLEQDAQATPGFEFLLFSPRRAWVARARLQTFSSDHAPRYQFQPNFLPFSFTKQSKTLRELYGHYLDLDWHQFFDIAHNTSYNTNNTFIIFITGYMALPNKHPNNQHPNS